MLHSVRRAARAISTSERERLVEAIANLDEKRALRIPEEILAVGADPAEFFADCRKAMSTIGRHFETGEYFLSDMIMGAEIFRQIMEMVKPLLRKVITKPSGRIVIGTVQGDIHDIGKNIVAAMLEAEGYELVDLGGDVAPEKFVAAISGYKPTVVGMSGLLTLAIESMRSSVDAMRGGGVRQNAKVIIGGGRVDETVRDYVGADAFADNVAKGIEICKGLLAR